MYPCLDFSQCICQEDKIKLAYNVFKRDFLDSKCFLEKILICSKSSKKIEISQKLNVEEVFWHIISRKNSSIRTFDEQRAKRIEWVKCIILDYDKNHIKRFYYYESNGKIRLYLWLEQYDFVVILEKIITKTEEAFIVTSFYIDNSKKKEEFAKKYCSYINKEDHRLKGCEWF